MFEKLLEAAIKFGRAFSNLTLIGQLVTCSVLILGTYQFASCTADQDVKDMGVVVKKTTEYSERLNDPISILADSVKKNQVIINKLEFQISVQRRSREKLVSQQSRLENNRTVETYTVVIVATQDTLIDNLKSQLVVADATIATKDTIITAKNNSIEVLQSSLALSETRADTLEQTLNTTMKTLKRKDKVLGFIPMPNRKTVALTALVGGIYLGTQLKK